MGGLLFNKLNSNRYHEVSYTDPNNTTEAIDTSRLELKGFVQEFLNTHEESSLILCIGADGGGLTSAYWTMRVLHHLDTLGLYKNIFMLSGASGGSVGEGIYFYMKTLDLQPTTIDAIIDSIGNTNFLSGDFSGLLTRWPMDYLPDADWIENRSDRMEAMSRHTLKSSKRLQKDLGMLMILSSMPLNTKIETKNPFTGYGLKTKEKIIFINHYISSILPAQKMERKPGFTLLSEILSWVLELWT